MAQDRQSWILGRIGLFVVVALVAVISVVVAPAALGMAGDNAALGDPLTARAVTAGSDHTCALVDNGTVKCWGRNNYGQLGLGDAATRGDAPNEMGDNLPAVDLGAGRTATAITAGTDHTCALLDNRTVKCWGHNFRGGLGLGDAATRGDGPNEMGDNLPAVDLGAGRTATAISAGSGYTCAVLDNATVKCWGDNSTGQLGLGDIAWRGDQAAEMGDSLPAVNLGTGRTATAVTAGLTHTCARLDKATVKCWGYNGYGGLGLGDIAQRGDQAGEMGNNLPAVDLGTGRTATAVSVNSLSTCAVLDNATVKCWGASGNGQLGLGSPGNRGDDPNEMGDNLPAVSLGTGRTATALGRRTNSHMCALLDNATVKCWGYNGSGQLGLGDTADRGDGPGEMGDILPAVPLGSGRTATAVTSGNLHSCALLDTRSVKCWGDNEFGQLGLGSTADQGNSAGEMGDNLPAVDLGTQSGVSGTVTESGSGAPVAGAWVAVLRTTDFSVAGGAVADGTGNYSVGVAPGSYYLYVIDSSGAHTSAFFGPPTTVTVTSQVSVDADPVLAPLRGAAAGTITEQGSGTPIGGAWALSLSAATGVPETATVANGSGQYTLAGLAAAHHLMVYVDPTGAHATRFFGGSTDATGSTHVVVTAGNTTTASQALPAQTPNAGGSTLTGTITETGTSIPLAGVDVMALNASNYTFARAAATNASGQYSLNVAAGTYKLVFFDSTGFHNLEWHSNHPYYALADANSVTAPAATNAVLDPNTGTLAGTITDDPAATPIAGAWVIAIGPSGIAGGATTAANGTYTIAHLPPGTYRAAFIDPTGSHFLEYYNNAAGFGGATPFNITAANTTTINAALAHP